MWQRNSQVYKEEIKKMHWMIRTTKQIKKNQHVKQREDKKLQQKITKIPSSSSQIHLNFKSPYIQT